MCDLILNAESSVLQYTLRHYLFNMIHSSNLCSPRVQIVVLVKLPIRRDDYLQAYMSGNQKQCFALASRPKASHQLASLRKKAVKIST
jgi:hypothetical protein